MFKSSLHNLYIYIYFKYIFMSYLFFIYFYCLYLYMDYKRTIEAILEVYNINASELAEKINVQRSSVSHILSGRNKPSLDFLLKIKNKFPDLRWEFVMQGKLPMKDADNQIVIEEKESDDDVYPTLFDDFSGDDRDSSHFSPSQELKNSPNLSSREVDLPNLLNKENQIAKIIWFYTDGSFKEFNPKS